MSDASLTSASILLGAAPVNFVFAYRVVVNDGTHVEGEVVLGVLDDIKVHELAHSVLSKAVLPTQKAVIGSWRDDSDDEGGYRVTWVGTDRGQVVSIVSWNGRYSTDMAEVRHPAYVGGYFIDRRYDDIVAQRIYGPLPEWPEAVWFLKARVIDLD